MGARSIARVVVSFGMTNIALKLFLSASSENVSFKTINSTTKNLVGQKLYDKVTGEEVQRGDCVKGYEYAKDQYVIFTDEEVANMAEDKRDTLDIKEFVPAMQVNPIHIEKTYYTGPDKGMSKSYRLLFETMKKTKSAAVGTWVSRGKEHLIVLRSYGHGIIAHQMYYDSEVRSFDDTCDKIEISPLELAMSEMLVKQFTKDTFDKSKYSDKYIERITKAVEVKLNGGDIAQPVNAPKIATATVDTLRASLIAMGVPKEQIDAMVSKAAAESGGQVQEAPKDVPKKRASKARVKKAS